MKKSDKLARKTRRMIVKNLIVLAALAVVAFAGVSSWFVQNTRATADGIYAETKVGDGLEFYIMPPSSSDQYSAINSRLAGNATWNSNNPNETPRRTTWHTSSDGAAFDFSEQEFKFMEGLFLCEVTSDGTVFQVPKLMQYDEVAYIDTTQDFEAATANNEYMSFDLYFRSDTTQDNHSVAIKSSSSIVPEHTYPAATVSDPLNKDYKDAAIGAVRMSVQNMGSNGAREVLWIPGPYVYYDGLNDNLYTGVTSYSNKGAVYYNGSTLALRQSEGTNDHAYYASKSNRQIIRSNASGMFVGSTLGSDSTVLNLTTYDSTNGYYYGHIRVNLWIEGEDAEARLAFVGGQFDMSLDFELVEN